MGSHLGGGGVPASCKRHGVGRRLRAVDIELQLSLMLCSLGGRGSRGGRGGEGVEFLAVFPGPRGPEIEIHFALGWLLNELTGRVDGKRERERERGGAGGGMGCGGRENCVRIEEMKEETRE